MRLINSRAILQAEDSFNKRKKLDPKTELLVELFGPQLYQNQYAILSHCWGVSDDEEREVMFKEMKKLTTMNKARRNEIRNRSGYKKILDTCTQAQKDHLDWVWIDTCCINKESSSELSEAINSMHQWYANSKICYAYLHDVDDSSGFPVHRDEAKFGEFNGWPKWFSRGWTLQELVAPNLLHFFNKKWEHIGDKQRLASILNEITRIPTSILRHGMPSSRPSVAQIISWAADRRTTREEDRAYSLLGLLGVHLPMLYGEGKNAFRRLQLEIIRSSNDQSIFAWGWARKTGWTSSFLADDPSHFRDCGTVVKMERSDFITALQNDMSRDLLDLPLEQLRTFTVTNDGIQIWLPIKPFPSFPRLFQTKLACSSSDGPDPITIVLVCFEFSCHRYFGDFTPPSYVKTQFKQLLLPYQDGVNPSMFKFQLDYRLLLGDWLVQHMVNSDDMQLDSFTLSSTNDYASVVVRPGFEGSEGLSFAVVLGYRHGQLSVHIVWDHQHAQMAILGGPSGGSSGSWPLSYTNGACLVKHVHFPQSTRGVRITCGQNLWLKNTCTVTIDVIECPGCCTSIWHGYNLVKDPDMPGLMKDAIPWVAPVHQLFVGANYMQFIYNIGATVKLGDYGYVQNDGSFQWEGNIFVTASVDPTKQNIYHENSANMQNDWVKTTGFDWSNHPSNILALQHATGLSLPNTQQLISLLKNLSIRLAGKCLVTKVVQCQQCYYTEEQASMTWPGDSDFTPDPVNGWKKLDVTTPLYTIMAPLVWSQQTADWETRKQFREIRYYFYILLGWENGSDDSDRRVMLEEAIRFFVDMFGGTHFTDFIGNITFFTRLPSFAVGTDQRNRALTVTNLREKHTDVEEDSRVNTLVQKLMGRIQFVDADGSHSSLFTHGIEFRRDAEKLRSRGFGAGLLLQVIGAVYNESSNILVSNKNDLKEGIDTDSIRTNVQKLQKLNEALSEVHDDDRRRALEEDMTGMILLTCWRGVRSEVEQVLTKVVDHVVNDLAVDGGLGYARALCLRDIATIFKQVIDECPDNGQCPLKRVLQDAEKGFLKNELFLVKQTDVPAVSVIKVPE